MDNKTPPKHTQTALDHCPICGEKLAWKLQYVGCRTHGVQSPCIECGPTSEQDPTLKIPLTLDNVQLPSIDEISVIQRNVEHDALDEFGFGFSWEANDGGMRIALICAGLVNAGREYDAALLLRVTRYETSLVMAGKVKERILETLRRRRAELEQTEMAMPVIEPKKGTTH